MTVAMHGGHFRNALVFVSFGISFLGAYVAISICEQLRFSMIEDRQLSGTSVTISHRKVHLLYLLFMAIAIGGVGIWSMHFIGMRAFVLISSTTGEVVPIAFDTGLGIASFLSVLVTSLLGLTVASYDVMFSKSKNEIVEEFIAESKKLSLTEIRKITSKKIFITIATRQLGRLIAGGIITGSGVCIMHYIGMHSMTFDGHIEWNPGIIAASILIAIIASSAAFWIFFRLLSLFPDLEWLRLTSAIIMAVAVCGMHYTGMVAGNFITSPPPYSSHAAKSHMTSSDAFTGALVGSNVMLWTIAIYGFWNSRVVIQKQNKFIRQADGILQKLVNADEKGTSLTVNNTGGTPALSSIHHQSSAHLGSTHSASHTVRNLAEQYIMKRYAIATRKLNSQTNNLLIAEKEQQAHMGFGEFLIHVALLFFSCKWRLLASTLFSDRDTSTHGSARNSKSGGNANSNNSADDSNHGSAQGDFNTIMEEDLTSSLFLKEIEDKLIEGGREFAQRPEAHNFTPGHQSVILPANIDIACSMNKPQHAPSLLLPVSDSTTPTSVANTKGRSSSGPLEGAPHKYELHDISTHDQDADEPLSLSYNHIAAECREDSFADLETGNRTSTVLSSSSANHLHAELAVKSDRVRASSLFK